MHQISSPGRNRRRGAVLAQLILCLTAVLGLLAVVLDGGILLAERRHAQSTADAAALAAAADLFKKFRTNNGADSSGSAAASATTTATANGYTGSNSEVTVNIPPTSGGHVGTAGYAEVIVQYNQGRFFSSLWGTGTLPIRARAVARGIWVTDSSGRPVNDVGMLLTASSGTSVTMNGGGNSGGIVLNNGSFAVNSTGPDVFQLNGHPSITAPSFVLVSDSSQLGLGGNPSDFLSGPGGTAPTIQYNQPVTPIPTGLSSLSAPSTSGLTTQSVGGSTLNPGIYNGGLSTSSDVTLNPGIYYLTGGGLTIGGNATLDGSAGVLIYITGLSSGASAVNQAGTASLLLNPIGTGTYRGVSIFVDPGLSGPIMNIGGTALTNVYGTVYAPSANLKLHGTPNGSFGSQFIASTVTVDGGGSSTGGSGPVVGQSTGYQLVE
jgi:hypothetical protein